MGARGLSLIMHSNGAGKNGQLLASPPLRRAVAALERPANGTSRALEAFPLLLLESARHGPCVTRSLGRVLHDTRETCAAEPACRSKLAGRKVQSPARRPVVAS